MRNSSGVANQKFINSKSRKTEDAPDHSERSRATGDTTAASKVPELPEDGSLPCGIKKSKNSPHVKFCVRLSAAWHSTSRLSCARACFHDSRPTQRSINDWRVLSAPSISSSLEWLCGRGEGAGESTRDARMRDICAYRAASTVPVPSESSLLKAARITASQSGRRPLRPGTVAI